MCDNQSVWWYDQLEFEENMKFICEIKFLKILLLLIAFQPNKYFIN